MTAYDQARAWLALQETIIAALVAKLGGDVHITMLEYGDAENLELYRFDNPALPAGMGFRVITPPVVLEGELENELTQ